MGLKCEENIDAMISVISDPEIHLTAAKGYKFTGITNSFDGSEDDLICRDAGTFWRELGMPEQIQNDLKKGMYF